MVKSCNPPEPNVYEGEWVVYSNFTLAGFSCPLLNISDLVGNFVEVGE